MKYHPDDLRQITLRTPDGEFEEDIEISEEAAIDLAAFAEATNQDPGDVIRLALEAFIREQARKGLA